MKKFALYLSIIAFLTGLVACEGKAWDTDESLKEITYVWSGNYIDYVYNHLAIEKIDTIEYSYKEKMYITTDYKDTLRKVIRFVQSKDEKEDSFRPSLLIDDKRGGFLRLYSCRRGGFAVYRRRYYRIRHLSAVACNG